MPRATVRNNSHSTQQVDSSLKPQMIAVDEDDYGHPSVPAAEGELNETSNGNSINTELDNIDDALGDDITNGEEESADNAAYAQVVAMPLAASTDPLAAMSENDRELAKLLLMLPMAQLKRSIRSQMGSQFDAWMGAVETLVAQRQRLSEAIVDQAMQKKADG